MATQGMSPLELIREQREKLKKRFTSVLAKAEETSVHTHLERLHRHLVDFMEEMECCILEQDADFSRHEKLSKDYIHILGKIGSRPTIEALEKSFRYHDVYGPDFKMEFPRYKFEFSPLHHKRSTVWNWVLVRDKELRKAATDNGRLSIADAILHIEHCWNFHSKWIHNEAFVNYQNMPVLHGEIIQNGYLNAQLPHYYMQSGRNYVRFEYRDTVRIMMRLSERAGYRSPEFVRTTNEWYPALD